ncbi:MAG: hypothetical protein FJ302_09385 [Planctomycetes bacterium]|nr:hypothetical protein [Planctomycetota bacterium]
MIQPLMTIADFQLLSEAEVCKIMLQDEGFDAVLADAELVNTNWFLGNAVGYIKLQVPSDQAQAAATCLQRVRAKVKQSHEQSAGDEADVCLSCGAEMNPNETACSACGWSFETNEENEA